MGLAIAYELAKSYHRHKLSIVVLEQEASFGHHISSRNSEVIHGGMYYQTDSLKAKFCRSGNELLYAHCDEFNVPYRKIGKLIVANK